MFIAVIKKPQEVLSRSTTDHKTHGLDFIILSHGLDHFLDRDFFSIYSVKQIKQANFVYNLK